MRAPPIAASDPPSEFSTRRNPTMKTSIIAARAVLVGLAAAPALAQAQGAAPAQAAASGKLAVDKTSIGAIWANPKGKAVLEKHLPEIGMYLDMIKDMTLVQVAP